MRLVLTWFLVVIVFKDCIDAVSDLCRGVLFPYLEAITYQLVQMPVDLIHRIYVFGTQHKNLIH